MVRLPEVRQPRQHDLIGGTFSIAGFDTGFEATVSWRVLEQDADVLAEGRVEGVGSMGASTTGRAGCRYRSATPRS